MKSKHPFIVKLLMMYLVILSVSQTLTMFIEDLIFPIYGYVLLGIGLLSIILSAWLQRWEKANNSDRIYLLLLTFLRYSLAFEIGTYGVSKLLDIQFQLSEHTSDLPIGKLSGFTLTWYYFSYSKAMAYTVGTLQCLSALLLVFRRTELVGALLLLPVIVNIVLINLFYDIHLGALVNSILFSCICLYITYIHSDWIIAGIKKFYQQVPSFTSSQNKFTMIAKWAVRFIVIAGPWLFIISLNHYASSPKTELNGVWDLKEQFINDTIHKIPVDTVYIRRIYFNSASSATWKRGDQFFGSKFSLNEKDRSIYLKLRSKPDSLIGTYEFQDSLLTITGRRNADSVKYVFVLARKSK